SYQGDGTGASRRKDSVRGTRVNSTVLKIFKLSLSAFRGIPGRIDIDLSSPLTLIYAPNGTGKTSFIDAAEWILTDEIRRRGRFLKKGAHDGLRCKFSPKEIETEVNAVIELNNIRYDLHKTPEQWLLGNGEVQHGTRNAILKALAPDAVDGSTDFRTAPIMQKMWLRGARFLTESDLSILVETDPEIKEERRQILSDLMGVRELDYRANEFRKFAGYLHNGFNGEKGIAVIEKELAEKERRLVKSATEHESMEHDGSTAESRLQEMLAMKEIEGLRRDISSMKQRIAWLKSVKKTAESAALAFNERSKSYCRWQRERLADVMFSIFGRIHANETFDLLRKGPEDDPFEWIAMAARQEFISSREFSMGQRQDLALSIFLAKARGVGGTFFLDEPIIRLDDLNRVALLDMFRVLVEEEGSKVRLVITTASRALVRHFQEKFINIPHRDSIPVLRVIELEGSPRDGVKVMQKH
ncbi:MAG TPA: AAA family ATPase, partial [Syntrophales bacterium]|nr:AAA family ATPase [Syntrophales bacterium]